MSAVEAYGLPEHRYSSKPLQAWRALLSWMSFLCEILLQILKGAPSYVGVFYSLTFSSSPSPSSSSSVAAEVSSGAAFKPLPSEIPIEAPPETTDTPAEERLGKLTIVLDLDETLICSYETSSLPTIVRDQAIEAGLKCFEMECLSSEKEADGKPKVNHVTVFERPGLHEFLQQTSKFADLVLFTAGLEGYARPLVDRIDAENRFILRLYRPATICTEYRDHVKDLSCLSKDLRRIVIVDNNPFSFLMQPLNGIPCVSFSAGQPSDEQLMGVLLPLLKHLSQQKDVRPVLYEKFHMPEWFQKYGIPMSNWMMIPDSPK